VNTAAYIHCFCAKDTTDKDALKENEPKRLTLYKAAAALLRAYAPAMRHLIDACIRADDSEKISAFDDITLIQMIVNRGADAIKALPKVSRTIRGQLRKPSSTTPAD
jgi:type I restriction enzyme R subunit